MGKWLKCLLPSVPPNDDHKKWESYFSKVIYRRWLSQSYFRWLHQSRKISQSQKISVGMKFNLLMRGWMKKIITMRDKLTLYILRLKRAFPSLHMCYTFNRLTNTEWLPWALVTLCLKMKCCLKVMNFVNHIARSLPFFSRSLFPTINSIRRRIRFLI